MVMRGFYQTRGEESTPSIRYIPQFPLVPSSCDEKRETDKEEKNHCEVEYA